MRTVALCCAAYLAAAALAGPHGVTIIDEVNYFTEADAMAHGRRLTAPESYAPANGSAPFAGPRYPLGWPALLAPATLLPWPGLFALPALLHAAAALLFAMLLKRRSIDARFALLLLAQPTLLLYSGTLMAEPAAVLHTVLLLWAAETESAVLLGFLAGLSPILKLSQAVVALVFAAAWLTRRPLLSLRTALGAAGPLLTFFVMNLSLYGNALALPGGAGFAPPLEAGRFLLIGAAQLTFTLPPLVLLGAIRARREERVTAAALVLFLACYSGFHYQGPSLPATLVAGARLHAPALALLLPGYAALVEDRGKRGLRLVWTALVAAALVLPWPIFRALAGRRAEIARAREATLAALRPGCVIGYSQFAHKLLVPFPRERILVSAQTPALLEQALAAGRCVDLLDPRRELSTNQLAPDEESAFARLMARHPRCAIDAGGVRIERLQPASCR